MDYISRLDVRDKVWEGISLLLLLIHALIIAMTLPSLPDTVSTHFNNSGQTNEWGNKNTLWVPFIFSILTYAFGAFVSHRPGIYRSRMTEKNLEQEYKLTSKMARTVKAYIILALICVTIFMIKNFKGHWTEQAPFLFLIIIVLVFAPCLYYSLKFVKIR